MHIIYLSAQSRTKPLKKLQTEIDDMHPKRQKNSWVRGLREVTQSCLAAVELAAPNLESNFALYYKAIAKGVQTNLTMEAIL